MLTRRALLEAGALGALAALAAACGSSATRPRAPSGAATTTGAGPGPTPSSGAATSTALPTGRVVDLGSRHLPSGQVISAADARRFAPLIAGRWRGAWRDTAGGSGTSDLLITMSVARRSVRATVDVAGPLLGGSASIAPVTYDLDLLGFAKDAAAWTVTSPQLGKVVATASGGVSLTGTATDVPGHPEIASIDLSGTRLGGRVDGRYTITGHDGSTRTGTIAWLSNGPRAAASDPHSTAFNSPADVLSGLYAASFATSTELSAAMGRPTLAPLANGGRVGYAPGIDVSNANAQTADGQLVIQYSVYRGATHALTAKFWHGELLNQPLVPGPWTAAFFQSPGYPTLYAYRGSRVLIVNISQTVHATHPPGADAVHRMVLAVAKALMPKLNGR